MRIQETVSANRLFRVFSVQCSEFSTDKKDAALLSVVSGPLPVATDKSVNTELIAKKHVIHATGRSAEAENVKIV